MTDQRIQQEAICYQWFTQRLILREDRGSADADQFIHEYIPVI